MMPQVADFTANLDSQGHLLHLLPHLQAMQRLFRTSD